MIYEYSETNRLEHPHSYMYTPFLGVDFLTAYTSSRTAAIQRCLAIKFDGSPMDEFITGNAYQVLKKAIAARDAETGAFFDSILPKEFGEKTRLVEPEKNHLDQLVKRLDEFTIEEKIESKSLLESVIAAQLETEKDTIQKIWLDRLVQRFEVSKKIFAYYEAGFRKGSGEHASTRPYWLMALNLSLYFARSGEIKYLSCLLKLSDLICSLLKDELAMNLPTKGIALVLVAEVSSIRLLAATNGIEIDVD